MTVPPGMSMAVYQEVKEYNVWSGTLQNVIGVIDDGSTDVTFLEGKINEKYDEIKYM